MPKTCIPRARLIDGNSHRFYVLFVGFPTCGRLDVSVQRGLCHAPNVRWAQLNASTKFLMRIGSTFAATELFGSLSLPECQLSTSGMPLGTRGREARARLTLLSRQPALAPSIWSLAGTANQRAGQVCC